MSPAVHQSRIGEKNPNAKLTAEQVAEIRQLLTRYSTSALARRFGVSQTCIMHIKKEHTWR